MLDEAGESSWARKEDCAWSWGMLLVLIVELILLSLSALSSMRTALSALPGRQSPPGFNAVSWVMMI